MTHTIRRLTCAAVFSVAATAAFAQPSVPDPTVTPGAVDPRVTQENIHSTVCVPGYSASVRPPAAKTEEWKREALNASSYPDRNIKHYEWDHKIPIEVGGNPTDRSNQWLEYRYPADGWDVDLKDRFENWMHRELCAGRVTLLEAQQAFADDWRDAYNRDVIGE